MKKKSKSASQKPIVVKIYTGKNTVGGTTYSQYTFVYKSGNRPVRQKFADLEAARREGE